MTVKEFYTKCTSEQRREFMRLCVNDMDFVDSLQAREFLESCTAPTELSPYIGIPNFKGMFLAIEADGSRHT